ncbi:interleukin-2 receptor subunit beta [Lissotriton helveticus]
MTHLYCYSHCYCVSLLLLLAASISSEGTLGLNCYYDTFSTLSCTWIHDKNFTDATCLIEAEVLKYSIYGKCNLTRSGANSMACKLYFGEKRMRAVATVRTEIHLRMKCYNKNQTYLKNDTLRPYDYLKLNPPESLRFANLSDARTNLTWVSRNYPYVDGTRFYEVRYRPSGDPWQTLHIGQDQQWLEIPALKPDTRYEVQVRTNQKRFTKDAQWSEWSESLEWKTPSAAHAQVFSFPVLWIGGICVAGAFIPGILLIIGCKRTNWNKKNPWISVPDPSVFFEALYGGDFKAWMSSPFPASSFAVVDMDPKISPVEITPLKDLPKVMPIGCTDDSFPYENSGLSQHSFHNQGYFLFDTAPCKVYFSYEPSKNDDNEDKNKDSISVGEGSYLAVSSPDTQPVYTSDYEKISRITACSANVLSGSRDLAIFPVAPGNPAHLLYPQIHHEVERQKVNNSIPADFPAKLETPVQVLSLHENLNLVEPEKEAHNMHVSGICPTLTQRLGGNTGDYLSLKDFELQYG